ncbi:MAG: small ligand-binding sensory domain FIST [Burkholderiaceae bacterium]|jgi:small ligand-binding sensory domain FIST
MAVALVVVQLRAQLTQAQHRQVHGSHTALGLVYITDHYAEHGQALLDMLRRDLPDVLRWVGTVGIGVVATGVEYMDEPALSVMLCDLPPDQVEVFSGLSPLAASGTSSWGWSASSALLHADGAAPELPDLIEELAQRTSHNVVFGGLASSRFDAVQFAFEDAVAVGAAGGASRGGMLSGGLSGVVFGPDVQVRSRVTQGCRPIYKASTVTAVDGHVVLSLGDEPALTVLLRALGIDGTDRDQLVARLRQTLVGLESAQWVGDSDVVKAERAQSLLAKRVGLFGAQTRVRHIVGLDVARKGVVVADHVYVGDELQFCERHVKAARADLVRVCAEVREEVESFQMVPSAINADMDTVQADNSASALTIRGAVYISCLGRGGDHFGAANAEMHIVQHALGDVPVVGFFAGGEIAHQHILSYSGVLMVFS